MYNDNNYLQLSGIQHYCFCKRQWALIHIEQIWIENYRTVDGELMHKNAHTANFELRGDVLTVHDLAVSSDSLGISGKCDVVEFHKDNNGIGVFGQEGLWQPYPVEYKRGKPKSDESDKLQLCAQAMCLEEMLCCEISEGALYYGETRHRFVVKFTKELRENVTKSFDEMHNLYKKAHTPKVKIRKGCNECSLKDICLPKLSKTKKVSEYIFGNLVEVNSD